MLKMQNNTNFNSSFLIFLSSGLIAASAFAPELTIISAGFDAARGDPLGMCDVMIFFLLNDCYFIGNFFHLDLLVELSWGLCYIDFWFIFFVILLIFQVTPAGYAQMTYLLNTVSGGKLLVILEGGSVAHSWFLWLVLRVG